MGLGYTVRAVPACAAEVAVTTTDVAADVAEQRDRSAAAGHCGLLDAVVAGDEAGLGLVVPRQRPHTGEPVDDVRAVDRDAGLDVVANERPGVSAALRRAGTARPLIIC